MASHNSMASIKTFSKSSYLMFKQCPKYFWYYINERGSIPEHSERAKFNFLLGHIIGELAKQSFPKGIEVGYNDDYDQNLKRTEMFLKERKPLFEAGILFKDEYYNVYSRADVLAPSGEHSWDIIEVKSSTNVKEVNLYDVAFQKYCYERAGIKIRRCFLMHINNQYVREGDLDTQKLFTKTEITEQVDKICPHIKNDLKNMLKIATDDNFILKSDSIDPEDNVGKFCGSPFGCPLKVKCWEHISKDSIFYLYSITQKTINMLSSMNIKNINEIPDGLEGINLKQKIQIESIKSATPYVDSKAIAGFLKKIKYPVYFLDFETFGSPVPLINKTKPYQNIPFQFSLHILKNPQEDPLHFSFLASGKNDPRKEFLASLKEKFGFGSNFSDTNDFTGSIIVYNESFEKTILRDLAAYDPSHFAWIEKVIANIVDLYEPFRNFYYYNKSQNGSASVKKVLPALTEKSYENMEIANGDVASISFLGKSSLWKDFIREQNLQEKLNAALRHTHINGEAEDEEKTVEKLRNNLHNYCKLDTEGMVDIYEKLLKITDE